ncbi:hypothetical protein RHCH11_RHCH11_01569 [Beijerinckiaceae bacterium RH CH11]|nr:hypothetical protein RHCH11_RHCH11_01569 [Beijerinckiaceae bacterium RH CH11]
MHEAGELERVVARALGLGRDRRRDEPPVHLRQDDVHREIGGAEAARVGAPLRLAGAGEDRLQHRRVGGIEHASPIVALGREGGGVDDHVGAQGGDLGAQHLRRRRVLQARRVERGHREVLRGQRVGKRDDRRAILGEHHRAVKGDQRAALGRGQVAAGGLVAAGRWQWFGLRPGCGMAERAVDPAERRADVVDAAVLEELPESPQVGDGQGRGFIEPRVLAVVAGQQREGDAVGPRDAGELVDAVAPVVEAAEQAHHDEARLRDDALDVEVDGIGMLELREAREAQRQRALAHPRRGRDGAEIAVGEGEEDDVPGALAEVDSFVRLRQRAALGDEEVHQRAPASIRCCRKRGVIARPRSPRGSPRHRGPSRRSPPAGPRAPRSRPRAGRSASRSARRRPARGGASACRRRRRSL